MSVAQQQAPAAAGVSNGGTRRFTVDEYYLMAEVGIIKPGERVELLDGEIVPMSPIGPMHAEVVERLRDLLSEQLKGKANVRSQNPVRTSKRSEPQPDVSVVKPRSGGYTKAHPTSADVLLLIEVSDTTLAKDRDVKLPLYAAAGIPEVWIVDLASQQIEQHYGPGGNQYRSKQTWGRGQGVPAQTIAGLVVAVDEVLG